MGALGVGEEGPRLVALDPAQLDVGRAVGTQILLQILYGVQAGRTREPRRAKQ